MHDCRSLMPCFKASCIGQCLPPVITHDGTQLKHNANYKPLWGYDSLLFYNFALCLNWVRLAVCALRIGKITIRTVERLQNGTKDIGASQLPQEPQGKSSGKAVRAQLASTEQPATILFGRKAG